MRHINLAIELCLFDEVRKTCTVVDVKVRHQQKLNFLWINCIKVRKRLDPVATWMDPAIQHNLAPFAFQVDTATTNFAT